MQWAQALDKVSWLQMYTVPGNCTPLGRQTTEGSLSRTWQARGGSLLLLPRRHALSSRWLWPFNHNTCEKSPGRSSRSCYQFSLPATSLFRDTWPCVYTVLVCGAQCSVPVRLGHWQSQSSNVCCGMTGQWSDRSAMSSRKTLLPSGPVGYLRSLALRIWTSSWRKDGSVGMDHSNGAVKTACDIQVDGKRGPDRSKMTWKQLTERDCREWKLSW